MTSLQTQLLASGLRSLSLMLLWAFIGLQSTVVMAASISAPASVASDSKIKITLDGVTNPRDFLTIVSPSAPAGKYEEYVYTKGNTVELFAPLEPGDYEIRWLAAASPYPTVTSKALNVTATSAELSVPASASIGSTIPISWQGPDNPLDFITLVPEGAKSGAYDEYVYTKKGKTVSLTAPTQAGTYEVRYLTGRGYKTLAMAPIKITDSNASLQFTSPARIGQLLDIQWSGPANPREYITIVKAGAAEGTYGDYSYVEKGKPLSLTVPEQAGDYEIRYMTADSKRTLASAPLQIVAAQASVQAADTVVAREPLKVTWTGPDNALDYIAITKVGDPASYLNYAYTKRGNPLEIEAPKEVGDYEVHYLTGKTSQSLAVRKLKVTPSAAPGFLQVVSPEGTADAPGYNVVEVVLDASGSMLQKLDGKRRIDIAKSTLNQMLDSLKSEKLEFALRVFGHRKADSCDTELLLPPSALTAASVKQSITKLEAKNLARTPIADSLLLVKDDLANIKGNALVILLTDGEETCNGDPEAAIRALRDSGLQVQVNIVGFAIGEYALKQQFSRWAQIGGGAFFDTQNGEALATALKNSLQVPFMVLDEKGVAVASSIVGGEKLTLPAGDYRVKVGSSEKDVTIKAGELSAVTFGSP